MAALFSNPAMLCGQPEHEARPLGRENAVLDFDEAAGRGEITFMTGGGRAMLKIEGTGLASGDLLVETARGLGHGRAEGRRGFERVLRGL